MNNTQFDTELSPIGKLRFALLAMLLLVFGGTFGFGVLEDMEPIDALYMTVITLSTVGFGEVTPLHTQSKIFAIIFIIVGFFVAASIITFLGQMIVEGQFTEIVLRRKMQSRLKKLKDHYIIAGFGRVGRHVAVEFAQKKVPFVVLETDEVGIQGIVSLDYVFVIGDATDEDVLTAAGIERAHTLISTLPQEALNVYLTLTARHMNPKLNIIARADFEEGEKKLLRAGADHVVIPHVLGGIRMAKAALQPNVVDFMQMTAMGEEGLFVEELVIPEHSKLVSRSLMESGLKKDYGVTIIGIKKPGQEMQVNPGPETELKAGNVLVLLGHTDHLERLSRDLRT